MPIVREETIGPVQTLQVFDSEEEAIRMANDSEYGLSACVWSRDIDRPIRVARPLLCDQDNRCNDAVSRIPPQGARCRPSRTLTFG